MLTQKTIWAYPNMTAFHIIILLSVGAPLTPAGGSSCNLFNAKENVKVRISNNEVAKKKSRTAMFYAKFQVQRVRQHARTYRLKSLINRLLAGVDIANKNTTNLDNKD